MTTQQLLNAAADRLEQSGWVQGYRQQGERCCALQALILCAEGSSSAELTDAALELQRRIPGMPIDNWNDAKGQTLENVLKTLRKPAA